MMIRLLHVLRIVLINFLKWVFLQRRWIGVILLVVVVTAVVARTAAESPALATETIVSATLTGTPGVLTAVASASQTSAVLQSVAENESITDGLIFGGVILVIIIVGGTLAAIQQNKAQSGQHSE